MKILAETDLNNFDSGNVTVSTDIHILEGGFISGFSAGEPLELFLLKCPCAESAEEKEEVERPAKRKRVGASGELVTVKEGEPWWKQEFHDAS